MQSLLPSPLPNQLTRLIAGPDSDAAMAAYLLPALIRPILAASGATLLSLTLDVATGGRRPAVHLWDGQFRPGAPARDYAGSRDMARLETAGALILWSLVGQWPAGSFPRAFGLASDGHGMLFDRHDPDPLAEGWYGRRIARLRATRRGWRAWVVH